MNFRLNADRLIISIKNSTISLMNSIFENTYFNNTMIDLSFFQNIMIENISFINILAYSGIKIDGNASNVIMKSIQFRFIYLNDYIFVFNSLDSSLIINDLEFFSFDFAKSNYRY